MLEGTIGEMKREFGCSSYQVALKRKRNSVIRAQPSIADPLYRQIIRISPDAERIILGQEEEEEEEERYFVPANAEGEREGTTAAGGEPGEPIVEIAALLENESASMGVERWAVECTSLQQIFMALVTEASGDEVTTGISSVRLRGTTRMPSPTKEEDGAGGRVDCRIATASASSCNSPEPNPSEMYRSRSSSPDTGSEAETYTPPVKENRALLKSQLLGLWYKQIKHYSRDWRFLFSTFVIPPLLITATMFLALLRPPSERPSLLLTPSLYGPNSNSFVRY